MKTASKSNGKAGRTKKAKAKTKAKVTRIAQPFAYYVEAVGPGGLILTQVGSEGSPETVPSTADPLLDEADLSSDDGEESSGPWLWIGVGGAVVAAVLIVIAIALIAGGGQSNTTSPLPPMIVDL